MAGAAIFINPISIYNRKGHKGIYMLPSLDTRDSCPTCPVGMENCPVLTEIRRLQDECARLQKLSETDPLTGLFNWRYLMSALDREMERTRRTRLPTGLIMIDFDHFKRINNTYGHQIGDAALRWVSHIWGESIRRLDILCRYGGEEFAVILPGSNLPQAVRVAHRLKAALAKNPLKLTVQSVLITASFGVATYEAHEDLTVEAFIQRADELLLEAKARGRNTVFDLDRALPKPSTEVSVEERATFMANFRGDRNNRE